jgi:hypothetical protein
MQEGGAPDASSASLLDASVPEGAADAADGATCTIPALAQSSATCQVTHSLTGAPSPCGPSEYSLYCSDPPAPSLGCDVAESSSTMSAYGSLYCCPCVGAGDYQLDDAGCLELDLSTFDRSCNSTADCLVIATHLCPGCECPNAAVNINGQALWEQAMSHFPPWGPNGESQTCQCASWPNPQQLCVNGVCTYPQPQSPMPPSFQLVRSFR